VLILRGPVDTTARKLLKIQTEGISETFRESFPPVCEQSLIFLNCDALCRLLVC
jgi:hypothetical protein